MSEVEPEPVAGGDRRHAATLLLLAVVASIAGALVTSAFSGSQSFALAGAVLGAAIPPVLAVTGPHASLRLGMGVVIAVVALLFTYGGVSVWDEASGAEEPTLPQLGGTAPSSPTPSPTSPSSGSESASPSTTPSTPGSGEATCEGDLCISWAPSRLDCSSDPCTPDVVVRSEGSDPLRVTGTRFTGDAADRLRQEGSCVGETLRKEEACSITVRVGPGAAGRAQLRIQQNLRGPASLVDLEVQAMDGPGPTAAPDLVPAPAPQARCSVVPRGALSGADNLTIFVAVRNEGQRLARLVPFIVRSDTGLTGGGNTSISTGDGYTAMQVDLRPADFGRSHRFTITVDPSDEIVERDESNNTAEVSVDLPARPSQARDVPCREDG